MTAPSPPRPPRASELPQAQDSGVDDAPDFYRAGDLVPELSIGFLMKRGLQSLMLQVDRALAPHDLTHAQWIPLWRIARGDCSTVATLARDQSQDPASMTRALDRLEAKGLVRRVRSASDRRVVQIELTDAGRQTAELVPAVLTVVLNQHLVGFSHDEWQQLVQLLQRVVANGDALREGAREPGKEGGEAARGESR